jgi:cytoskeletal protein RodZ
VADIGATLREARLRARIDIGEVETRTKIRAKYLRAIENEEWDLLPGPVYAKSFLRTYGDYLGLDSRMLVDEFRRQYEGPSDHDTRPISPRTRDRDRDRGARGPLLPPWALIGLVLVAIVVALYFVGSFTGGKPKPSTTTGTQASKPPRSRHHRRRPPPSKPTTVKLQLVPTGPVYVCLVNGAGAKLINEQTFSVGQTIPTQTAPKLLLTLGNASVQMKVNGHTVPVTPSASAIRLMIDPSGTHSIPLSTPPTCP